MGTTSRALLVGATILIVVVSALIDSEFAAPPAAPAAIPAPLVDLSHLANAPPSATIAYRVRGGDTLEGIAERIYGDRSLSKLIRTTSHEPPKSVRPGQTLIIPGHPPPAVRSRPYVVREGDSLYVIAERVLGDGDRWRAIYDANRDTLKSPSSLRAGQVLRIIDDL